MFQAVRLEEEVDVGTELNPPARRQCEQSVVVQHGVQCLYPFRVDVAIADHPGPHVFKDKEVCENGDSPVKRGSLFTAVVAQKYQVPMCLFQ